MTVMTISGKPDLLQPPTKFLCYLEVIEHKDIELHSTGWRGLCQGQWVITHTQILQGWVLSTLLSTGYTAPYAIAWMSGGPFRPTNQSLSPLFCRSSWLHRVGCRAQNPFANICHFSRAALDSSSPSHLRRSGATYPCLQNWSNFQVLRTNGGSLEYVRWFLSGTLFC